MDMDIINSIKYSRSQPKDLNDVYDLHVKHFGELRSKYVWEWQYGNMNPNYSILLLGKVQNKTIATQGAMAIELVIGNKEYITGKNESLLIDPDFRKKGVFREFYEFAFEEYKKANLHLIWGFTKAQGPFNKVGFTHNQIINRSIFPLNYRNAISLGKVSNMKPIKAILYRVGAMILTLYSKSYLHFKLYIVNSNPRIEIVNELKSERDLPGLFVKIRKELPHLIHINFNKTYVNWRIEKAPNKIIGFYAYRKHEFCGYLLFEMNNNYSEIIDFVFTSETIGRDIMNSLYSFIRIHKIKFISYSGNSQNSLNIRAFKLLRRYGFIRMIGPNGFVLKAFTKFENQLDLKNWYITSLWFEGI